MFAGRGRVLSSGLPHRSHITFLFFKEKTARPESFSSKAAMKKRCGLVHTRACSYPILLIVLRVRAAQKTALKKSRKFNLVKYTKTLSVRNRHNSLSHSFLHDTRANTHYFAKWRRRVANSGRADRMFDARAGRATRDEIAR
jgi:hypothetical protein